MTMELRVSANPEQLVFLQHYLPTHAEATRVRPAVWAIPADMSATSLSAAQLECGPFDYVQCAPRTHLQQFGLLVSDMDSTLITIECIDEIADFCGRKKEVAAITEATMRGEIASFEESLRRRVAILKGLPATSLQRVYDERLRLSPGAEILINELKQARITTLLVSGGFTFFTSRLKERLSLDDAIANELEIVDGVLSGAVLGKIIDGQAKADALLRYCQQLGIPPSAAIAAGDGSNDLLMMKQAGLSVAFHAKPVVQASARMIINHGGLDRIPFLLAL